MWLLDVHTLDLHEFVGSSIPSYRYAILSHTWGAEEVTFAEMKKPKHRDNAQCKAGFNKIRQCCAKAERDGLDWAWIDTCCIDKRSSAELSEAINSMYEWYSRSSRCYVYLEDISSGKQAARKFPKCRWFSRGWTLQELIAPRNLIFFAKDWTAVGFLAKHFTRQRDDSLILGIDLAEEVSSITAIPKKYLEGQAVLTMASIAERMFWASRRETTRPEDRAYSLMGLFEVHMPVLYGEGLENAFLRLQLEIMKRSLDDSIFAWLQPYGAPGSNIPILAGSPDKFRGSGDVTIRADGPLPASFSMTNLGLQVTLPVVHLSNASDNGKRKEVASGAAPDATWPNVFKAGDAALGLLNCASKSHDGTLRSIGLQLRFLLYSLDGYPVFWCSRSSVFNYWDTEGQITKIVVR